RCLHWGFPCSLCYCSVFVYNTCVIYSFLNSSQEFSSYTNQILYACCKLLVMEKDLEKFDLACTYLKNDQNMTAHNMFMDLAQKEIKNSNYKAGLYLMLALECKQGKEKKKKDEPLEEAKSYLKVEKKDKNN